MVLKQGDRGSLCSLGMMIFTKTIKSMVGRQTRVGRENGYTQGIEQINILRIRGPRETEIKM